jgi:hypothetical protein
MTQIPTTPAQLANLITSVADPEGAPSDAFDTVILFASEVTATTWETLMAQVNFILAETEPERHQDEIAAYLLTCARNSGRIAE